MNGRRRFPCLGRGDRAQDFGSFGNMKESPCCCKNTRRIGTCQVSLGYCKGLNQVDRNLQSSGTVCRRHKCRRSSDHRILGAWCSCQPRRIRAAGKLLLHTRAQRNRGSSSCCPPSWNTRQFEADRPKGLALCSRIHWKWKLKRFQSL
jgi:hypothetical protein